MDKRNWKIVYTSYSGMEKKAIETCLASISKCVAAKYGDCPPYDQAYFEHSNQTVTIGMAG